MFDPIEDDNIERVELPDLPEKPSAEDIVRGYKAIQERAKQDDERDNELAQALKEMHGASRKAKERELDFSPGWKGGGGDVGHLRTYIEPDQKGLASIRWAPSETPGEGTDYLDDEDGLFTGTPTCEWQKQLQHWVSIRSLVRAHLGADQVARGVLSPHTLPTANLSPKTDRTLRKILLRCPEPELRLRLQKIFDNQTGTGGDWIPTQDLMPSLIEPMIGFGTPIASQLERLTTSSGRVDLPALTGVGIPYLHGIPTEDTPGQFKASNVGTTNRSTTLQGIAIRHVASIDAMEDSIVLAGPLLMRMAALGLTYAVDDALINGDSNATHDDTLDAWNPASVFSATPAGGSDDHRRAWLGWRAEASDNSATNDTSGAWTWDNFISLIATLKSAHALGGRTVVISSFAAAIETMKWDEFQGLDKVGTQSVLTASGIQDAVGFVRGSKGGIPILLSPFMTEDLNASGVFDNVTTTKTGVVAVDLGSYIMIENARGALTATADDITRGIRHVVTRRRLKLLKTYAAADKTAAFSYNI